MPFVLSDFRSLRPRHLSTQAETLQWLAQAHTRAEATLAASEGRPFEPERFLQTVSHRLQRFGCGEDKIAKRGYETDDCSHTAWDQMDIYRLAEHAGGKGMKARTQAFGRIAARAFTQLFCEVSSPPEHLIHVTCTGYESPSAAQRLVASRGWGSRTRVTHAYHMGCYAALPAVRMAAGFAALAREARGDADAQPRVDIVHTELCSLHTHPLRHEPEQLVIQSLFADGCISYSLRNESQSWTGAGLKLLSQDEWIVEDSAASMAWSCSDEGMEMVLARDVPQRIADALPAFVARLLGDGARAGRVTPHALFAIHPGGPKIIDQIAAAIGLTDEQVAFSRAVLRERGNMSSATLPHIWQRIVSAQQVLPGTPVVSLAFGPGLTLSGAVLEKVGPQ